MDQGRKEVLTISIEITLIETVKGSTGEATMIYFRGYTDGEWFTGSTDQDGIDTQIQYSEKQRTLSARYILRGVDRTGEPCRLFIENQAVIREGEPIHTFPKIITDSKELAWLETAELSGEIEASSDALLIHIYANT